MEYIDLVDEKDRVVGVTDKKTAHVNKQIHRVVALYVFNYEGELYVQVHRSSGGRYDHSVGGHVKQGESYGIAAQREAKEELGLQQPLEKLSTILLDDGPFLHMFGIFECIAANGWQFTPNNEVEEIVPMKFNAVRKMMIESPEKFTGGFINTMKEYCRIKNLV